MRTLLLGSILLCVASPSTASSPEALKAKEVLENVDPCTIGGVEPLRRLINQHRKSRDPEIQLIVAKARSTRASAYWFRGDAAAGRLLKEIVRLYDSSRDPAFQAIAADARLTVVATWRRPSAIRKYIDPIVSRYKDSTDVQLSEAYAQALYELSGLAAQAGNEGESLRLYDEAGEVLRTRVEPFEKPSEPGKGHICI